MSAISVTDSCVRNESAARSADFLADIYHESEYSMSRLEKLKVVIGLPCGIENLNKPGIVLADWIARNSTSLTSIAGSAVLGQNLNYDIGYNLSPSWHLFELSPNVGIQ